MLSQAAPVDHVTLAAPLSPERPELLLIIKMYGFPALLQAILQQHGPVMITTSRSHLLLKKHWPKKYGGSVCQRSTKILPELHSRFLPESFRLQYVQSPESFLSQDFVTELSRRSILQKVLFRLSSAMFTIRDTYAHMIIFLHAITVRSNTMVSLNVLREALQLLQPMKMAML